VSKTTTRKHWTASENDAFTKALSDNPSITVAQLKSLPELRDRHKDSIKTKLREHKTVPLSEAKEGGKGWSSEQDDKLKAAYKDHGMDLPKLLEAADGRTQKAVYDRIRKFDKEKTGEQLKKTVGEHEGLKKTVSEHEGLKKVRSETLPTVHEGVEKVKTVQSETRDWTVWAAELMKGYIVPALEKLGEKMAEDNRAFVADSVRHVVRQEFMSQEKKIADENLKFFKSQEFAMLIAEAIRGVGNKEMEK
jgi:hypothetical protein